VKRPSPALATSLVALFFSLGGVAIATEHYLITSTSQIKPSVLRDLQGDRGPQGPAGKDGAPGPAGATGATGSTAPDQTLSVVNVTNQVTEEATGLQQVNATCPSGYALTGGGAGIEGNASSVIDSSPDPSSPTTAWSVIYNVPTIGDIETAEALCAELQTP
jgi:hypothetical protein